MNCISDITKKGTASKMDKNKNDIIFNTNPIPPWSNDVPANMLLFHISPAPINDNPAKPNVRIPIRAALRFC